MHQKELRPICYDPRGNTSIPIPECIEAVYFGLRCSEEHKEKIKRILSDKKFVKNQLDGCMMDGKKTEQGVEISGSSERRLQEESTDILFYEMKKDPEHYGRIRVKRENSEQDNNGNIINILSKSKTEP